MAARTQFCTCGHERDDHAPFGRRPCWWYVGRGRECDCTAWRPVSNS